MSKHAWPSGPWTTGACEENVPHVMLTIALPSVMGGTRNMEERDAHSQAMREVIQIAPDMAEAIIGLVDSYGSEERVLESTTKLVKLALLLKEIDKKSEKLLPTFDQIPRLEIP